MKDIKWLENKKLKKNNYKNIMKTSTNKNYGSHQKKRDILTDNLFNKLLQITKNTTDSKKQVEEIRKIIERI